MLDTKTQVPKNKKKKNPVGWFADLFKYFVAYTVYILYHLFPILQPRSSTAILKIRYYDFFPVLSTKTIPHLFLQKFFVCHIFDRHFEVYLKHSTVTPHLKRFNLFV